MKRNHKIWGFQASLLVLLLTFGWQQTADAQTRPKSRTTKTTKKKTDDYFDESGGFKHRLWYGGQTDQGLFSFFGGNFNFGLEPIIGYKVTEWASLGVVTGIRYRYESYNLTNGTTASTNLFDLSYGAFARLKPMKSLFIHAEYRNQSFDRVTGFVDPKTNKLLTAHFDDGQANVGLGYTTGSNGLSYEISILYNVLYEANKISNYYATPFNIKIGLIYNY